MQSASPTLFDLTELSNFADDNFVLTWTSNQETANNLMVIKLKLITKWLSNSGLKEYESKTEKCLFYIKGTPNLWLNINNTQINLTKQINVLNVIFDSK